MSTSLQETGNKRKSKIKQRDKIISILKPGDQDQLYTTKYQVIQLKHMCKHYKLQVTGKKVVLITRLYDFLKYYVYAQKIQWCYKDHLLRKYIHAKGPAFMNRSLCVNESDFFTMDPVSDISIEQFVSFTDKDGKIYGFDLLSLYNLWLKTHKPHRNPYNRNIFPTDLEKKCELIYKFSGSYFNRVITTIESLHNSNDFETRCFNVFQEINQLGNYADHTWYVSLSRLNVIRFVRELLDIWCYRAELSASVKMSICPPHGNPFAGMSINILPTLEMDQVRQLGLTVIQNMVLTASDIENRSLGANFVLCALTLVSESAAISLPWLYQSVSLY